MTPKEIAKHLVDSNIQLFSISNFEDWIDAKKHAKESSLLSVEFARQFITGDLSETFDKTMYLFDIKQEIEKL